MVAPPYQSSLMTPKGDLLGSRPNLDFAHEGGWDGRPILQGKEVLMIAFFRDEEGQGLVEYALIIAVIAIAVIVAMVFLRGQIQNIFSNIGNNLT
jgi:pilus assembly protein Flp/PilA